MNCPWCQTQLSGETVSLNVWGENRYYHSQCFSAYNESFKRCSPAMKYTNRHEWEAVKQQLQKLLPMNGGLSGWILSEVHRRLTPKTRKAIDTATLEQFLYVPKSGGLLVLRFRDEAIICHAAAWSSLDEFCKALKQVTGISRLIIEGSDLKCRIWFDQATNQWIRESLEVA